MLAILQSLGMFIVDLFKSRPRLEAENLFHPALAEPELRRTCGYSWFSHPHPAEFERADDLLIRRPNAGKNHADR
jgi:hypothetical protein